MYHLLVKVKNEKGEYEFKALRPTNGLPYEFASRSEASRTMHLCYPDSCYDDFKIVEIKNEAKKS